MSKLPSLESQNVVRGLEQVASSGCRNQNNPVILTLSAAEQRVDQLALGSNIVAG